MHTIQGSGRAAGFRFAVVVSKYNDFITDRLQAGALEALAEAGVAPSDITLVRVPGAAGHKVGEPHEARDREQDDQRDTVRHGPWAHARGRHGHGAALVGAGSGGPVRARLPRIVIASGGRSGRGRPAARS